MGLLKVVFFAIFFAVTGGSLYYYFNLDQVKIPEEFFEDNYWLVNGKSDDKKEAFEIKKFTININDDILTDLSERLNTTRFVKPLDDSNFSYGFNGDYLKDVVKYWLNNYKWRTIEKQLNKFEHFKVKIEGLEIHYMHVKPKSVNGIKVIPLLLVHGWPGSFYEFVKMAPILAKEENGIAFELIIPSMPGYGFSQAAEKQGLNIIHMARIFNKLMLRLGHERYYYHGGDWGSAIGKFMSIMYPDRVAGYHTTMAMAKSSPCNMIRFVLSYFVPNLIYDEPEIDFKASFPIIEHLKTTIRETGYLHIQATKPDTVASSVINSPAGLAAYILEKFSSWTNMENINKNNGGLTEKFTMDELLTNVMIYWVTDSFPSSVRLYKESFSLTLQELSKVKFPSTVPVGLAYYPNELAIGRTPKVFLKEEYPNIVQHTNMPRGGHFPAFEEPEMTASNIRTFVYKCIQIEDEKRSNNKKEL